MTKSSPRSQRTSPLHTKSSTHSKPLETLDEVKTVATKPDATNRIRYEKPSSRKNCNQRPNSSSTRRHQKSPNQARYNQTNQTSTDNQPVCSGCGENHPRSQCRFLNANCLKCVKKGHISKVCRSKTTRGTNNVTEDKPAENIAAKRSTLNAPLQNRI